MYAVRRHTRDTPIYFFEFFVVILSLLFSVLFYASQRQPDGRVCNKDEAGLHAANCTYLLVPLPSVDATLELLMLFYVFLSWHRGDTTSSSISSRPQLFYWKKGGDALMIWIMLLYTIACACGKTETTVSILQRVLMAIIFPVSQQTAGWQY